MSLIRKHVAVLQAWACLALVIHTVLLHVIRLSVTFMCAEHISWATSNFITESI